MSKELPEEIKKSLIELDRVEKITTWLVINKILTEITESGGYSRAAIIELLQDIKNEID